MLERSLENPCLAAAQEAGVPTAVNGVAGEVVASSGPAEAGKEPEAPAEEQQDVAFRDLLARVNLAQARLQFLSEVLQSEFNSVQGAIGQFEKAEEQARSLADGTGRLAADQENLRRSIDAERQTLAAGAETLGLVKTRFAVDLKDINQLLDAATEKTATLSKSL